MELRSPDSTCNPYLAFMVLIEAGLEGIKKERKLQEALNANTYNVENKESLEVLPKNLGEALEIMKKSEFVKSVLGEYVFNKFLDSKEEEWEIYKDKWESDDETSDWEINNYFYKY